MSQTGLGGFFEVEKKFFGAEFSWKIFLLLGKKKKKIKIRARDFLNEIFELKKSDKNICKKFLSLKNGNVNFWYKKKSFV